MRTYGIALFHRNGHEAGTGSGGRDGLRRQGRAPAAGTGSGLSGIVHSDPRFGVCTAHRDNGRLESSDLIYTPYGTCSIV